jgi:dTDP-4-amino-4,6-dideoxygalactose transaminase
MPLDSASLESTREEFEKQIASYVGTRYAIACSSGRSAIRFSLLALGIGHGDEVIVPDFACEILPITVFCTGALPRLCDINRNTLSLSPIHLQKALRPNTKAAIFTHLYGIPVDPSPLMEITQKKGIALIDDAAQALGASIQGKKAGSFGDVGILSLNKFLDVRLGGVALTNNDELATKIRLTRQKHENKSFLVSSGYRMIEFLGIKSRKAMSAIILGDKRIYRLLNFTLAKKHFKTVDGWVEANPYVVDLWRSNALTSAIINQLMAINGKSWHRRRLEKLEILSLQKELEILEKNLEERRTIAKIYQERLKEGDFNSITASMNAVPSYMKYPIVFLDEKKFLNCVNDLIQSDFETTCIYRPLHKSPLFNGINKDSTFEESIYASNHVLPIPVDPNMSIKELNKIISIVNSHRKE